MTVPEFPPATAAPKEFMSCVLRTQPADPPTSLSSFMPDATAGNASPQMVSVAGSGPSNLQSMCQRIDSGELILVFAGHREFLGSV